MTPPRFDYYWRDYHGDIPEDAIRGGTDRNGEPIYIGQLLAYTHGLLPTTIYKGQQTVSASGGGFHTSSKGIKILCSSQPEKFIWIPVDASSLHVQIIEKHPVVGGHESDHILNIGRAWYQEGVVVGKVCGYNVGKALMYFPDKKKEVNMASYEILVFDNNAVADIEIK